MIIKRYLKKEITLTVWVVTIILVGIFMSNQFVRYLNWVAVGKYASSVVLRLLLVQIPLLIGLLLPLGLYVGILLSFARLYVDSEMVVLSACGLSQRKIFKFVLEIAFVIAGVVAIFTLWLNPAIMAYKEKLLSTGSGESIFQTIFPGRFETTHDGSTIYYVESLSRDRQKAQGVFMATLPDKEGDETTADYWRYMSADSADQYYDENMKANFLVMHNGYRYFGEPGKKDFRIIKFSRYGLRLPDSPVEIVKAANAMSTLKLWALQMYSKEAMAELQWRIALPLSTLLLAFLAIPLSKVHPRSGRFLALLPAILIYVIYANLIFLGRSWIEQGTLSIVLGLWWVHLLLFLTGIFSWVIQFGWRELKFWS
jgi:lipopolysaccharide export system permease protein